MKLLLGNNLGYRLHLLISLEADEGEILSWLDTRFRTEKMSHLFSHYLILQSALKHIQDKRLLAQYYYYYYSIIFLFYNHFQHHRTFTRQRSS